MSFKEISFSFRLLVVILVLSTWGCGDDGKDLHGDQKDYNPAVLPGNSLIRQFVANHAGLTILKYAQADLNNDELEDLIIIYRLSSGNNMMCILYQKDSAVFETNSVPAPVAEQMIQFRDIDDAPPLEFILQGRKGAKVGYAIFRLEDGELIDIFGVGMEDCC